MRAGGDPGLATAIAAGVGAATSLGSTLVAATKDSGPPQVADSNKKALASYGKRLAEEEQKMMGSNDFLLRPGGRRISFDPRPRSMMPQNKFMLT